MLPIQLDYQATTPCAPEAVEAMLPYWGKLWGNPSSRQHGAGLESSAAVQIARERLAACLNVAPERLIFTSGATEANNLALLGHARAIARQRGTPGHMITLSTEHHSVLNPLRQLQREGFRITEMTPEPTGLINPEQFSAAFEVDTLLASIMVANNEIGVLQPLQKLAAVCQERGVALHSDAAQAFGHCPLDPDGTGIDLLSLSAHKLYGPKGIGALLIREGLEIDPLQWGGGQEQGIRPGTLPVPLVIGFARAAELAMADLAERSARLSKLRELLWQGLQERLSGLALNGCLEHRLPHNLNFSIYGVRGTALHRLLRRQIYCGSGSACSQGKTSHVLLALGRSPAEAEASLRLSLGRQTEIADIETTVEIIGEAVKKLRGTS
ncbi:cysteine desulfurase [cyanobiont of Ornithocercus magnificus]|nr:cysteine desulfurase [cyanobiont of Ornithocercus magnificus]